MGHPTGQGPEHDPHQGHPQQWGTPSGPPPQGYPQQPWPQAGWGAGPPGGKPPGNGNDNGNGQGRGNGRVLAVVGAVSVILVAALVAVVVVVVRLNGSVDGTPIAAAGSSSVADTDESTPSSTDETPSTPESPSADDPECPAPKAAPGTPAGWKTVAGKRGLSYDVPPEWEVESCGTLVGWEGKCEDGPFGYCPIRTMSGAATLHSAQCPKNAAGMAGTPGASDTDDIDVAVRAEADLVEKIYTSESGRVPRVSLSAPSKLTVGGAPAVQIIATVRDIETAPCVGSTAVHAMIATTVPGQQGTVLFVISLPQGVPGATDALTAARMAGTLRRSV